MSAPLKSRPVANGRARSISISHLREQCRILERAMASRVDVAEQIDPYKPGKRENAATDAYGWLSYYRHLQRLHAVRGGATETPTPAASATDEGLIDRALREEPIGVELSDGSVLAVGPLSEWALGHLDARDKLLDFLATKLETLGTVASADDVTLYQQVMEEIEYQQAVCTWISTSDVTPRLPFDPIITPRPDVPARYHALVIADRVRIQAAFHKVNGVALAVLRASLSIDPDTGKRRSNWRTFFSTLEKESGIPAKTFMRDRALVAVLASRLLAANAEQEAFKEAKADAERKAKDRRTRDA